MYLLIAFFGICVAGGLFIIFTAPEFDSENLYNKEATTIYYKDGTEMAKIGLEKRDLITYDELPEVLVDAIVATEDSRFFQHNGFDIARFTKAFLGQITGNSAAGGGSTLSMQVVKNSFTDPTAVSGIKGLVRKATDIYMSVFKLEKNYTKEQIIEFYVNEPWLGNQAWGVEQACQTYFGKSVKDLSLNEAAIIAGMFNAPASYNPFNSIELTTKRRNQVLNLMVRHGYISDSIATDAKAVDIRTLLTTTRNTSANQGAIDTVVADVYKHIKLDGYSVPMDIYSTIEKNQQDYINKIMAGENYTFVDDIVQMGIAVTSVKDGSISAVGTGRNQKGEKQWNHATRTSRQIGSSAKPFFAYGPLIEYTDASTYTPFFDEVYTYSNGSKVHNADRKYLGLITMRYALARSRNIPALQAFQLNDKAKVTEFAHACGIDFGDTLYESYTLGTFNMSPLELSSAYGVFARGGYYIEPYAYTKVVLKETDETFEHKPIKTKAMSKETAFMMNYMLQYAVDNGVIGSVNKNNVAAKTGTSSIDAAATKKYNIPSSSIMDSWVSVYNPDYAFSLWYGYEDLAKAGGRYLTATAAGKVRSKVARMLVSNLFDNKGSFPSGGAVTKINVEKETFPAKIASPFTPSELVTAEYFKKGTEPTEVSDRFNTLANPTNVTASYTNGNINVTWDKIATPNAISTTWLQNHFNTNYGEWAEKYYNARVTYNNTYIGTNGYEVYLKNSTTGALTSLGFTTNNYYNYPTTNTNASYTFVIKSAYTIFKANMSSGAETTINPYEASVKVTFNMTESTTNIAKTDTLTYYTDMVNPFKMFINDIEATGYTFTTKFYKVGNPDTQIDKIPLNEIASYKINYIITYQGKTYTASRKVEVK